MKSIMFAFLVWICLYSASSAIAEDSPLALAENTSQKMLTALRDHHAELMQDSNKIYDLVQEILLPHFDFNVMSQWVMGKYWRQATPEQRDRFINAFRTLLVNTYAKALLEYTNERIEFLPMAAVSGDDVTVRSEVHVKNAQPIPIHYSMHRKDGAWKVYDVTIEGISLITNYRGTIGNLIRNEGMEGMLEKLSAGSLKGNKV